MREKLPLIICFCLFSVNLYANNDPDLSDLLTKIKDSRIIIQKSSTAFLATCKQLESGFRLSRQEIKVTSPLASIREDDLITSKILIKFPEGQVLPVLRIEGEWYKVKLPDLREGWIYQDDVQQIKNDEGQMNKNQEMGQEEYYRTRMLAENFFLQFSEATEQTDELVSIFEKKYKSLSDAGRRAASLLNEELSRELDIIKLARIYSNHYHQKLPALQVFTSAKATGPKTIGFDGTASVKFGSSVYESGGQISETTRSINLAGNVIFNPRSRLALQLSNNKDVIRTPYTTSDVNATYFFETSEGTRLSTSVNFQDYGDEIAKQNSYRNLGASVTAEHPLSPEMRVIGDVRFQSKSYYDNENGNDLEGVQFSTNLDYNGKKTVVNAGIRGRFQSSDIAFLDYHRIIPNLRFTYKTGQKKYTVFGEAEQLVYGSMAGSNNSNRIRLDLESATLKNRTQLTVINKSYPNNVSNNNLKIRILTQVNTRTADRNGRSTGYLEYTFQTSDSSTSSNYVDLRFDRYFSRKTTYFDIGAYGRYWEEEGLAHRLSLYSRFGFKISGIQIGPVVGADIMIDPADPDLQRIGNSFRAGVDGRGNFLIQKAKIYSSVRYQYTLAYSGLSAGGVSETRKPFSLETTAGAQIPLVKRFEIQFDLRYYSLDFDFPETDETLYVQNQSGLRFLAGINYRF